MVHTRYVEFAALAVLASVVFAVLGLLLEPIVAARSDAGTARAANSKYRVCTIRPPVTMRIERPQPRH